MKLIPAGSFPYGKVVDSYFDTPRAGVETNVEAFYMDSTEVTQKEFTELMGFNPSYKTCENCAVSDVTFYDGILVANARSLRDGLDTVYEYTSVTKNTDGNVTSFEDLARFDDRNGYRLANAVEFKYALRGGTETDFFWGTLADTALAPQYIMFDNDNNVFPRHSNLQPVATKLPNPFGLYDMLGNGAEDAWSNATTTTMALAVGKDFGISGWPHLFYAADVASITPWAVGAFATFRLVRNHP
jgi:formylglycine-generating enzyme required for sulfatase activity